MKFDLDVSTKENYSDKSPPPHKNLFTLYDLLPQIMNLKHLPHLFPPSSPINMTIMTRNHT